MKRRFHLLVIATNLGWLSGACLAEDLSCKTKVAMPSGEWTSFDLRIVVDEGKVTSLSFDKVVSSGRSGGAYSCHVDSSTEANASWTHQGRSSVLRLTSSSSQQPSVLRVTRSEGKYLVSFTGMSRDYCGFGAEFPQSVELRRGDKRCRTID